MGKVSRQCVLAGLFCGALVGCQVVPTPPSNGSKPPPVHVANPKPVIKPVATREQTIQRLLREADYALAQDQLLMPLEDNAYDRYQAVLLMDKNNAIAKTGIQAISLRYIELARDATAHSRYAQAQVYLNNARDVDPDNAVAEEFAAVLRKEMKRQKPVQAYSPGPDEHIIDAQELSNHSKAVIAQLGVLAQQAKASGDLVMIHARNDAEGRWIYQQMRNALPGFLLRGDIKISQQPRIQFVPRLQ